MNFDPIFEIEQGKIYRSRKGIRFKVLLIGQHGQDCSYPMIAYTNIDPTSDSPPNKIWMIEESIFLKRFFDCADN